MVDHYENLHASTYNTYIYIAKDREIAAVCTRPPAAARRGRLNRHSRAAVTHYMYILGTGKIVRKAINVRLYSARGGN